VARYEHLDLLGTVAAQTLRLAVDRVGLDYEVDLPDTSAGNDVLALTQRRDLRSSSFSFQCCDQELSHEKGVAVRHLVSVRLIDVSPVTIPAYPDSSLALRSLAAQFSAEPDDVFQMARDNQLSKLFVRTDTRGRPATTLTGRQALVQLLAMKPGVTQRKTLSPAQARKILTDMRYA
jgi:HK97 family phage prohead protease